jgi:hypothetical protein
MNKTKGLLISVFASMLGVMGFASAQWYGSFSAGNISQQVVRFYQDFFTPIFQALFGTYYNDSFLFAKILLFFLLVLVISFSLKKTTFFEGHKKFGTIIAVIVALLAIRFMPENYITDYVMVPYSTLGIALTVLLPFIIFFFFVHSSGMTKTGRKLLWGAYGIIFLIMWLTRDNLSGTAKYIYLGGLGLIVASFFFDDTIKKYFGMHEMEKATEGMSLHRKNQLKMEINQLSKYLAENPGDAEAKREMELLKGYLENLD